MGVLEILGRENHAFGKPCFCLGDTGHFHQFLLRRHCWGVRGARPCFLQAERKFVIFAGFVKALLAGDESTIFQKQLKSMNRMVHIGHRIAYTTTIGVKDAIATSNPSLAPAASKTSLCPCKQDFPTALVLGLTSRQLAYLKMISTATATAYRSVSQHSREPMPVLVGRPACRTMDMKGGSSA